MSRPLPRRLYRSRDDRMLSGVSGGLADYFDVDPALVRLLWVLGTLFSSGLALIAYLVLWIVVPLEGHQGRPSDVVRANIDEMASEMRRLTMSVKEGLSSEGEKGVSASNAEAPSASEQPSADGQAARARRRQWAAALLIALGALLLASNLGAFWWFEWRFGWPVLLIVIRLLMLWNRVRG